MKVSRKTILNILFMAFVLSFFVTPLGYYGKILLNQIFSFRPEVIEVGEQQQISDYNWKLKNANWEFFPILCIILTYTSLHLQIYAEL